MRDRLIELITKEVPRPKADALAGWLLANGVIAPPCKVGDVVYFHQIIGTNEDSSPIEEVRAGRVYEIQIEKDNQIWLGVSFGIWHCCRPYTDFYLTKEGAEEKLKELGK